PVAGRRCPIESAVGSHLRGQVDNVVLANRIRGSNRRCGEGFKTPKVGETSLFLETADAGAGMEYTVSYLEVWIWLHSTEIAIRILYVEGHFPVAGSRFVGERNAKEPVTRCG